MHIIGTHSPPNREITKNFKHIALCSAAATAATGWRWVTIGEDWRKERRDEVRQAMLVLVYDGERTDVQRVILPRSVIMV